MGEGGQKVKGKERKNIHELFKDEIYSSYNTKWKKAEFKIIFTVWSQYDLKIYTQIPKMKNQEKQKKWGKLNTKG